VHLPRRRPQSRRDRALFPAVEEVPTGLTPRLEAEPAMVVLLLLLLLLLWRGGWGVVVGVVHR
jgi:hypothetical protein